ncbi:Methyltransferase FkbM [Bartonella choladocola]|uniref:Methyltransferase, FkbM family n=1 Tax=Bartonella choladocola TaxID=2750995 RepID=A0A1U9MEF3_9HYPH|nr:methyltransferase, FkbM family [Bartonella choladocola]
MGLRRYLKINQILSRIKSLDRKLEQEVINQIQTESKTDRKKADDIIVSILENNGVLSKKLTGVAGEIDYAETDINQKLDKIFNKISSLDNDVNKKEYVINDDRVEIIKNLIKDERARHIVLNMEFEGADLSLRIDDSDIRVFKQIFVDNEYDSLNLPETAKTIIDLGANIGLSVFFFIKKFPDARIVAVEPDAVNFSIMEKNLEKFSKSVSLLQAAIWPTDGEVSLVEEDDDHASLGAWGYRTEASKDNSALSVKAISIPTIMKQYDMDFIDILKVDIEGAEYELFEKNYEDWIDKVGLVIIETHDRFKPNSEAVVRKALKGRFDELPMKGENLFFKKK